MIETPAPLDTVFPPGAGVFSIFGSFQYMREKFMIFALYARSSFHFMSE